MREGNRVVSDKPKYYLSGILVTTDGYFTADYGCDHSYSYYLIDDYVVRCNAITSQCDANCQFTIDAIYDWSNDEVIYVCENIRKCGNKIIVKCAGCYAKIKHLMIAGVNIEHEYILGNE